MMRWLLFYFLLLSTAVKAQDELHPILQSSGIQVNDGTVVLNWVISGGNTCNGIKIFRTDDLSNSYAEIGFIDGICGSTDEAVPYSFVDPTPLENTVNYYRITFGAQGSQEMQIEFVALGSSGTLLAPNPMTDESILYFNNESRQAFSFTLFDLHGNQVRFQEGIKAGFVPLHRAGLTAGLYLFLLVGEDGRQYQGKLVVR